METLTIASEWLCHYDMTIRFYTETANIRQATNDIKAMIDRKETEKTRKKQNSGGQKLTRPDVSKVMNTVYFGKPIDEFKAAREAMGQGSMAKTESARRILSHYAALRCIECHPLEQYFELGLRQLGFLERCKRAMQKEKADVGRRLMYAEVLRNFPCPDKFKTPLEFTCLQEILKTYQNYEHQLIPQWNMS